MTSAPPSASAEHLRLLRQAGREISVTGFLDYRRYLDNLYRYVKTRAETYSYVAFSIHLGLGKSNASRLIICGERNLAEKSAEKVATGIGLRGSRATYFELLVAYAGARASLDRETAYNRLMVVKSRIEPEAIDDQKIGFFGNWLAPVITEMMQLKPFEPDPAWIQDNVYFPLRLEEVKKALQVLVELGYLEFDKRREKYKAAERLPEGLKADTLTAIAYHQQMIETGKESLTRIPGKLREVSGCTTKMSQAKYERIKAKLKALIDEAAADDEPAPAPADAPADASLQSVFQLNVQLFPFTKIPKGGAA
jgi:uncharacterized protein (TIGR02147 family)